MSIEHPFSLQGQVALITGAGRGIGRAIAVRFAQAGARVVCAARTQEQIEETVALVRAAGSEGLAVRCNVASEKQLQELVERSVAAFGRIDILVNNAGGAMPNNPLKTAGEQLDQDYHFNVTSAFNLTRLAHPHLLAQRGNVINITSAAARYAQRGFSSYGAAKAALSQLTRLLAADFAPAVRVNGIAPGTIMTDALEQFLDDGARQKMIDLTPMQSLGQPDDIALAALYLAAPAARWVTGKILEVDGGAEATTWPY